jgi:hypothetical protein
MVKRRTGRNRLLSSLSTASRYLATTAASTEKFPQPHGRLAAEPRELDLVPRLTLIHSSNLDFHKGLLQLARAVGNDVGKARRETTYVVATGGFKPERRDSGLPCRGPRTHCPNCDLPPAEPSLCLGPDKGLKHTLYVSPVWGRLCNSVARRCLVAGLRYDFYSSIARLCEFLRKLCICSRRTAGSLLYTFDLRQEPSELLVVEV